MTKNQPKLSELAKSEHELHHSLKRGDTRFSDDVNWNWLGTRKHKFGVDYLPLDGFIIKPIGGRLVLAPSVRHNGWEVAYSGYASSPLEVLFLICLSHHCTSGLKAEFTSNGHVNAQTGAHKWLSHYFYQRTNKPIKPIKDIPCPTTT